jgi:4-hydroxy-4-methyl-2-oxoglutarate aldolase
MMNEEREWKYLSKRPPREVTERFYEVTTPMVSDALDKLGLPAGAGGIVPMYPGCKKIVGPAITMKVIPFGYYNPKGHMGSDIIKVAEPGDVLVYDNGGKLDQNCWGDILAWSALKRGITGTIAYGAMRDIDECAAIDYPIYAMGSVPTTGRGRVVQLDYLCPINVCGILCYPGDLIMADRNGVVVIPCDRAAEVLEVALDIKKREEAMVAEIKAGIDFTIVDKKSGYDTFLRK